MESIEQKLDAIYKKYSEKDYWGTKRSIDNKIREWELAIGKGDANAQKFTKQDIIDGFEKQDRAGFEYMVQKIKKRIEDKDVKGLKSGIRYDQKMSQDVYEVLTGKSLKGMNNKELGEYFDVTYGDGKMGKGGTAVGILKVARRGVFSIDSIEGKKFKGYTFNGDWNGWAVPYFERDETYEIARALGGRKIYYPPTSFLFPDEDEEYKRQKIKTVDGEKTVYPIGAYNWVWEEVEAKAKGGDVENKGIDLFEDYEKIPANVQKVLDKYEEGIADGDYEILGKAKDELEEIGYTFEYYVDGEAYDLRKIGEMGKVEYAEKHYIGLMGDSRFEDFAKIVKKSDSFEDAWKGMVGMEVSTDVADAFDEKYNPDKKLSLKESFKKFYDEVKMESGGEAGGKSVTLSWKIFKDNGIDLGKYLRSQSGRYSGEEVDYGIVQRRVREDKSYLTPILIKMGLGSMSVQKGYDNDKNPIYNLDKFAGYIHDKF